MNENHKWGRWDDPGVAEVVDRYWSNDPSSYELLHRSILGSLVKKYLVSPTEKVLEVGCGSGLIYGVLVTEVVVNSSYLGVDTSSKMLDLARKRFPMGQFIYGDAYDLPFPSKSFDVALCFEVLGHLSKIQKPINELFRVAARLVIFTVWVSPEDKTLTLTEEVGNSKFLHKLYPQAKIAKAIRQAANDEPYWIEIRVLSDTIWAYIIFKGPSDHNIQVAHKPERVLPFQGLTDFFIHSQLTSNSELQKARVTLQSHEEELGKMRTALESRDAELGQVRTALETREKKLRKTRVTLQSHEEELGKMRTALESRDAELGQVRTVLETRETELEKARVTLQSREEELGKMRGKGKSIVHELDLFRHRKVIRWVNRFLDKSNLCADISPSLQQLKDDSLIFNKRLKGYRLQPSLNLQRVPFLCYSLDLSRSSLKAVLLAPILDLPLMNGVFGIEIVSPSNNNIVAQCAIPLSQINESVPTRFDFPPIRDSDRGRFWLRVFARDVDAPVRIFEWRKYPIFGLGPLQTRVFCGFLFEVRS